MIGYEPRQHPADTRAEVARCVGSPVHDLVDLTVFGEVGGRNTLCRSEFWCVLRVTMHDDTRTLRRQRRQPRVVRGESTIRREQRERRATGPPTEQHRHRWPRHSDEICQTERDLTRETTLFGVDGQVCARCVDHRDDGQAQFGRQHQTSPGDPQVSRADQPTVGLHCPVLPDHHGRRSPESTQRQDNWTGVVDHGGAGIEQQRAQPATACGARRQHAGPGLDKLDQRRRDVDQRRWDLDRRRWGGDRREKGVDQRG